jgi:Nicotinate phosphoribosyltransferase (NAPRTase) N-terminal domain/Nicotinate phosphoribosyltransferase (NAPRTase) family
LAAGLGPALAIVREMEFGEEELAYLRSLGFGAAFLEDLAQFRFSGDIDAMPEGTIAFAGEPLVRVTAPRVEAQLLETLLLKQINFQTMVATKAARIALAAGGGAPAGERLVDFSPRRDHGTDATMNAARAAAIAGSSGTSNLVAAMRYGLTPMGTMAHSYVMSFEREEDAFRAFMQDFPGNAVMLVDTYDTVEGVRRAIAASQSTGVSLAGVRLESGDLLGTCNATFAATAKGSQSKRPSANRAWCSPDECSQRGAPTSTSTATPNSSRPTSSRSRHSYHSYWRTPAARARAPATTDASPTTSSRSGPPSGPSPATPASNRPTTPPKARCAAPSSTANSPTAPAATTANDLPNASSPPPRPAASKTARCSPTYAN